MEELNRLATENIALIIALFNLVYGLALAALAIIMPLVSSRHKRAYDAALAAKDATIEMQRVTINEQAKRIAETDGYEHRAVDEQKQAYVTIEKLHKRISELEASQFFDAYEDGSVRLRASVPRSIVKKLPDKAGEQEKE